MDSALAVAVAMIFGRKPSVAETLAREVKARSTGMSLHYLTLYGILTGIRGDGSMNTLEFGAGKSTAAFLASHKGCHTSIDPVKPDITRWGGNNWYHFSGKSVDFPWHNYQHAHLSVVLHDGAHDAETVEHDLRRVIPRMRCDGLILVHDTLHSEVGHEVRAGMDAAMKDVPHQRVTLPYGFGLTILQVRTANGPVDADFHGAPVRPKRGSEAWTTRGLA